MAGGPVRRKVLEIKGGSVKKRRPFRLLNAMWSLPYHLRAGRYQCFGQPNHKAAQTQSPARWRAGYLNSRSMEDLNMRTYDLAPFYRSTVGFDRFFSLLDQAASDGSPLLSA